ncbi:MAG: hypothetical protein WBN03_18075, partial [Desulfobacterales bacterium]
MLDLEGYGFIIWCLYGLANIIIINRYFESINTIDSESIFTGQKMSWDWEKLKEQQQKMGGGAPPNVDEIVQKIRNFKFPGGPFLIVILLVVVA